MPSPSDAVFLGAEFQKSKHRAIAQSPVPGGKDRVCVRLHLQGWLGAEQGPKPAQAWSGDDSLGLGEGGSEGPHSSLQTRAKS